MIITIKIEELPGDKLTSNIEAHGEASEMETIYTKAVVLAAIKALKTTRTELGRSSIRSEGVIHIQEPGQ